MGIIGHPVLAHLVVTIDYPRRRLMLQKPSRDLWRPSR